MTPTATLQGRWWQHSVIYQVYPRSFQDTNGDGIGDLRGILARLDYLESLGIQALWLSPIYPSPMDDFGYDICDYTNIDPVFGTLAEFDELSTAIKARSMKLIVDFVPNHTSDRHPWFQAARVSRDNMYRDWYLWRDPAPGGGPPNNWLSQFGGGAWEWDQQTGQYYYHAFLKSQPDLNWRNPAVRAAMHDVLRFWLRRGVDGFRVDVLWHLIKDAEYRDNPPNPDFQPGAPPHHSQIPLYTTDRPEVQDVVLGLRRVVDEFKDCMLIGEIYLPLERLVAYYGTNLDGVHLPFNFQLLQTRWTARGLASLIDQYEGLLPAGCWPNWVLGNHDNPRIASRVGVAQARVAAVLLLTLRGTPTMYYGDEVGMVNVPIPADRVQDPFEKNVPGVGVGRDCARTPMQWTAASGAGFTTGEPWLPLSADHQAVNVETESSDPRSLLTLYRKLLRLRASHEALSIGTYEPVVMTGDLLAYVRRSASEAFLIALNMGPNPFALTLSSLRMKGNAVLSTYVDDANDSSSDTICLRANEGVIVMLAP